jgi:hypothetical protein
MFILNLMDMKREISIKKTVTEVLTGNAAGTINTYRVTENGREFLLIRKSNVHGSSVGIAGKEGILYVDSDDNRVHRQVVALSGACGLNTDDELVEGLSPWSLRGVRMADQRNESGEVTIISEDSGSHPDTPVFFIDGKAADFVF